MLLGRERGGSVRIDRHPLECSARARTWTVHWSTSRNHQLYIMHNSKATFAQSLEISQVAAVRKTNLHGFICACPVFPKVIAGRNFATLPFVLGGEVEKLKIMKTEQPKFQTQEVEVTKLTQSVRMSCTTLAQSPKPSRLGSKPQENERSTRGVNTLHVAQRSSRGHLQPTKKVEVPSTQDENRHVHAHQEDCAQMQKSVE